MPANRKEFDEFINETLNERPELPPVVQAHARPVPRTGRAAQRKLSEGSDTSLIAMFLWLIGGVEALGGIFYAYQVGMPLAAMAWIPFFAGAVVTWGFALVIQLLIEIRDELRKP